MGKKYELDIIKTNEVPDATQPEVNDGKILIVSNNRLKKAPSQTMKGDKGDKLTFEDLSPGDINKLQQPAKEAAAEVNQLTLHLERSEAARATAEKLRNTNEENRQSTMQGIEKRAEQLINETTQATSELISDTVRETELITERSNDAAAKAETAASLANQKAADAKIQGDYAKAQGDYAAEEGGKAADAIPRIDLLELYKADGVESEDGKLWLTSGGIPITDPVEVGTGTGGSGSGGGSKLRIINRGSSSMGVPKGQPVTVKYNWTSVDSDTDESTGDATAVYYVNNVRVFTQVIRQGDIDFNITNYLSDGQNQVRIQITDSYGAIRSLNVRVEIVNLRITSTFNDSIAYEGEVSFVYNPIGAGTKTIHFILDGVPLPTVETISSNRPLTYKLPALTHGSHSLEVYAGMLSEGIEIKSNTLYFSIIYIEKGNNNVIISSSFNQTDATQYDVLNIPYSLYDPAASSTSIQLKANGEVVSTQIVDRMPQVWSYRIPVYGALKLEIVAGNLSKVFDLTVAKSSIDSEAETEGLELFLTSNGRSNNEDNPALWENNGISASLKGFNFKSNGWVLDAENVMALRISQGAKVEIPFMPFFSDFKNTGKTLEFEFRVSNVEDFSAPIISCLSDGRGFSISANDIMFKSALSSLETKFKEDESVRLSFVVEGRMKNRIIYIYLNGIMSKAIQYVAEDNFEQTSPIGITLGHPKCVLDVYNIRSYLTDLNSYQILNNYISDTANVAKKLRLFDSNQIFDAAGEIIYSQLVNQLPCMTIIGELPTYKGDKQTSDILYENRQHPELSFETYGAENDVQGTSSQFYPRKNFKFKIKNGLTLTHTGEKVSKYALTEGAVPVSVFCMKADFAESSGTHNTGIARFVDEILRGMDCLTPPQKKDTRVRTTIDGYPCAIFHKETADSPAIFIGKYNFNNDKGSEETYGFDGTDECWEFLNNTSDNCLFKTADFTSEIWDPQDSKMVPVWTKDWEARYIENKDNPSPTNLKALSEWIVSCIGKTDKFRNEISQHFNLDNLLSYYLLTEFFGATDQRAKNMMLASWGNEGEGAYKWYFIFYDNDTVLGINNEGANVFPYSIEDDDQMGSGYVFNGWDSELWKLVKTAFQTELTTMYRNMRQKGLLSYAKSMKYLNEEQADKWCEVIYNMDGLYKYIQPLIDNPGDKENAAYIYALQGSRTDHRIWWLKNRFTYMDSKYNAADFLNDYITLRTYTPTYWEGVEPNADFNLTLFKDSYVRVRYGSYDVGQRAYAGETVKIEAPEVTFNDTETIVYGVSTVSGLGDLSSFYPGTVDISKAISFTELRIGSGVEGYKNDNLTHVGTGSNKMLRLVDIRNCPCYTEPLDLSGCDSIEEIYAQGSNTSMVTLPQAGILRVLSLPASIDTLSLRNQLQLTDEGLQLESVDNITTLVLENMNSIDQLALLKRILATEPRKLNRVRLTGIELEDNSLDILLQLAKIGGLDESGGHVEQAIVTGKFTAQTGFVTDLANCRKYFPELDITVEGIKEDPTTIFEFNSSQVQPITNGHFTCNRPFIKISENRYSVMAPIGAKVDFTFSCDNHVGIPDGSHTITSSSTRRFTITYIPKRTLVVRDQNNVPIPGAVVTFEEKKYTADSEGKAYIRTLDMFEGYAEADGFGGNTFSFQAVVKDDINYMTIYPYVNITFQIIDSVCSIPLEGATVTVNNETKRTDQEGKAVFRLFNGQYTYSAKYKSNPPTESNLRVGTSDLENKVAVKTTLEDIKPEADGSIQMLLTGNNTVELLVVTSSDEPQWNYSIDWGDGTEETLSKGQYYQSYSHTYSSNTPHLVRIHNCEGVIYASINNSTYQYHYLALWSIGNSKITGLRFYRHFGLRYIGPDIFKNDINRESFSETFSECHALLEIPEGLFDGCVEVKQAPKLFYNCRSLQSIPSGLFRDCSKLNSLSEAFYNCTSLTFLPTDLLDYTPECETFYKTFENCTGLKSANIKFPTGLKELKEVFSKCSSLENINPDMFVNCREVYTFQSTFNNCSKLSTIPEGFFMNCEKVTSLSGLFAGCTSLISIPTDLFKYCTEVTDCYSLFGYCSSLNTLPKDLFRYNTKVTTFNAVFAGCSTITTVPAELFRYNTEALNFGSCFAYSGITTVPADLFYYNSAATNFDSAFRETRSLTDLPARLWNPEANSVNNINSLFNRCIALTTIRGNIFNGLNQVKGISQVFEYCSVLETIPDGLFNSFTQTTTLRYMFTHTAISSIPADLFKNCIALQDVTEIFRNCRNLTSIPNGLFSNLYELRTVEKAFQECQKLTHIPTNLFKDCIALQNASQTFTNCKSLTEIPEKLFADLPDLFTVQYVFNNCSSLQTIPGNLFENSPKLYDLAFAFASTSITAVPDELLSTQEAIQNIRYAFLSTKITEWKKTFQFNPAQHENQYYRLNTEKMLSECTDLLKVKFSDSFNYFSYPIISSSPSIEYIEMESRIPAELYNPASYVLAINNSASSVPPIYVPDEAVEDYKTATNWVSVADKIFPASQKPA